MSALRGLILLTPLLLACGDRSQSSKTTQWPLRPDCADGELIGWGEDGTLSCVSYKGPQLMPQNCLLDQVLTSENGHFKCVAKGNGTTDSGIVARIMNAQSQLNQINDTVNNLLSGSGQRARFLGLSAQPTTGRIVSTTKVGITAAMELCAANYPSSPTAHMCTVYEMYDAAATGQLKQNAAVPRAWVYMIGWNNPAGAADTPSLQEGDAGMNENCGAYTYRTASNKWTGTAVAWEPIAYSGAAMEMGLKFYSGMALASCTLSFPIACCD